MKENQIHVIYGTNIIAMVRELLDSIDLEKILATKFANQDKASIHIGLKPNLVIADTADNGATTHPEIAEAIIIYLKKLGYHHISIIEGSWIGDRTQKAFKVCGYTKLQKEYAIDLIDTQKDKSRLVDCNGMLLNICDSVFDIDFMINLPVLKGHCQTNITCALKNNKGLIPNTEKRRFHTMGLHQPIAYLNSVIANDLIIVDGICGDLDFEEGGNPVHMNRIFTAFDPVLCDTYVCELLGYDIDDVPYIRMASELKIGSINLKDHNIIELNKAEASGKHIEYTRKTKRLSKYINQNNACSACYANLIRALSRFEYVVDFKHKQLSIGQGFKDKSGDYGIGSCTSCFQYSLTGCPPKTKDIIAFIKKIDSLDS